MAKKVDQIDIVTFAESFCGQTLTDWQKKMLQTIASEEESTRRTMVVEFRARPKLLPYGIAVMQNQKLFINHKLLTS